MNTAPGPSPVGRTWPPVDYEVGREKIREYAAVTGEESPIHYDAHQARGSGFRNVVAPPMFCAVYCAPAMARAAFDPAVGIDRSRLVHGEQMFEWSEPVCAGDTIATSCELADLYAKGDNAFYVFASTSRNQAGAETMAGRYTGIVRGGGTTIRHSDAVGSRKQGDGLDAPRETGEPPAGAAIPEFRVTPDKYLPFRYAGASGDFTPIHIDAEFARAVGLPGIILHGLYTMAVVAHAQTEAAGGDPRALRRLRVRFRGIALPEAEIRVTGRVREEVDGLSVVEVWAAQGDTEVVSNAEAILASRIS